MVGVFLGGSRAFELASYHDLGLTYGTMIGNYTQIVFLVHFVVKEFGMFTSVLNERQTLGLASYYGLGLVFGTITRHYTHVDFFIQFIVKGKRILIHDGRQEFGLVSYYSLVLTLETMTGNCTQIVFFFHYFKWSKLFISHIELFIGEKSMRLDQTFSFARRIMKMVLRF